MESESFLLALQQKIDDAKKALTDKMLAAVETEVQKEVEKEKARRIKEAIDALPPPPPPPDDPPPPPMPLPHGQGHYEGASATDRGASATDPNGWPVAAAAADGAVADGAGWPPQPVVEQKILPPPPPGEYDPSEAGDMDIEEEEEAPPPVDPEVEKAEREEAERQQRLAELEERARRAEEARQKEVAEKAAKKEQQKLILGKVRGGSDKPRPKLAFGFGPKK